MSEQQAPSYGETEQERRGRNAASCMTLLLFVPGLLLHGWVLHLLWGWFVTPVFAAPALPLPYAIGLLLLLHLALVTWTADGKEESPTVTLRRMLHQVGTVLLALAVGWVVHLFT